MLIHSKELLMSGGKKQPIFSRYRGTLSFLAIKPYVGQTPIFGDNTAVLKSKTTNSITIKVGVLESTVPLAGQVSYEGLIFNRYFQSGALFDTVLASPDQQAGDTVILGDIISAYKITAVSDNSITVTETSRGYNYVCNFVGEATDYIYRA